MNATHQMANARSTHEGTRRETSSANEAEAKCTERRRNELNGCIQKQILMKEADERNEMKEDARARH